MAIRDLHPNADSYTTTLSASVGLSPTSRVPSEVTLIYATHWGYT